MPRLDDSYTRHARPILWLLREGEVTIGDDRDDRAPAFRATVQPFYLAKAPVTNEQFEAYDPEYRRSEFSPDDEDVAVGVNFADATGYCAWYARVSRKSMRLPTEVEWEYACRAGNVSRYPFGDDPAQGEPLVWDCDNATERLPDPRRKPPNAFGLWGMLGCVWEWTASLYRPYPIEAEQGAESAEEPGPRVLRGGSIRQTTAQMGSAIRRATEPELRADDVGFRIARSF